jgi:translation elongation factor EF-Tu-like GTPase
VDTEPYFLTFQTGDKHQVVNIDKVNKSEPDFIARVTYLTTEQGGRKGYAASGYRPPLKFEGRKELTSGEQLFIDKDKIFPGETVTEEIRILSKEIFKNYLYAGQRFEVVEGPRLVGNENSRSNKSGLATSQPVTIGIAKRGAGHCNNQQR